MSELPKIISVTQGDNWELLVPLYLDGVPCPVFGWRFWMTVKRSVGLEDSQALFQKSTDGGTIIPFGLESVHVVGSPADTKTARAGQYFYDIQGVGPDGDVHSLEDGFFVIKNEITRAL